MCSTSHGVEILEVDRLVDVTYEVRGLIATGVNAKAITCPDRSRKRRLSSTPTSPEPTRRAGSASSAHRKVDLFDLSGATVGRLNRVRKFD